VRRRFLQPPSRMVSMCGPRPAEPASEDRDRGPQAPDAQQSSHRLEALQRGVDAVVGAMAGEVQFANDNERAFALFRRGCHHCAQRPEDLDAIGPKDTILAFLNRVAGRKTAARQLQELGAILVQATAWRELFSEAPAALISVLAEEEQGVVAAALAQQVESALAPPGDGTRVFLRERCSMRYLTVWPTASWVAAAPTMDNHDLDPYDSPVLPWDQIGCDPQQSFKEEQDDHFERGAAAERARCVLTERATSLFICSHGCSSSFSTAPVDAEGPTCPLGHVLQPWTTKGGACDGCGRETWRGEQVLDCRECDWYLCQSCHSSALGKSLSPEKRRARARASTWSSARSADACNGAVARSRADSAASTTAESGVVLGFAHEGVPALGRFLVARKPWPASLRSAFTGGRANLELFCASKCLGRQEEFRWGADATIQHVPSGLWLYVDPSSPGTVCLHAFERSTWEALSAT